MTDQTTVALFRRDLRVADNPMLTEASARGKVAPLFVFDPALLAGSRSSPNRNRFLLDCLRELRDTLREMGSDLHIRHGEPSVEVARFATECGATAVFCSRDYTPYARRRDEGVGRALQEQGIAFKGFPGTLVHEPGEVTPPGEKPLSVYTPFRKRWEQVPERELLPPPGDLSGPPGIDPGGFPDPDAFHPTAQEIVPAGERAAGQRLTDWCQGGLAKYADERDLLAGETTSRLSQDLHFGTLSPLQVIAAARNATPDAGKFISEVAWREFYHYVLWFNPRLVREPFQQKYEGLPWSEDDDAFEAWQQGQTGYPVVDAAMRQLLATGYMHNRARMVVASFLTKHLLIDWRKGEDHFLRHLVDGDIANNNGGWQWSASTGTDPQPYFRIFNPVLQGKRYDPDGEYVRRWVPELRDVPGRYIHEPWEMPARVQTECGVRIGSDYPAPIVEHGFARERALEVFGGVGKGNGKG